MNLERIFKSLIFTEIGLLLLFGTIDILFPDPDLPQELQLNYVKYLEDLVSFNQIYDIGSVVFCLCFVILYFVGLYKLYKFQNSGRLIYVFLLFISIPGGFLLGNKIVTPWTDIINNIGILIAFSLIALMYFSPLKEKFTKKKMRRFKLYIKYYGEFLMKNTPFKKETI